MLASLLLSSHRKPVLNLKFVSYQNSHGSANNDEKKKIFVQLWGQFAIRILEHRFLKLGFIVTNIVQERLFFKIFSDINVGL